jgi:uncharacterized phage-associated protein
MTFNEKKTTQAAARLLGLANKRMNYMKLIKLLYLVDREALIRWGRPVTGDKYFSMKYGPVLSSVLDLINEQPFPGREGFWVKHISPASDYEVWLIQDAGCDELSQAEEKLIGEIYQTFGHLDPFDLVDHLHNSLPEWTKVTEGCTPIQYEDILTAGQKSPQEIRAIQDELEHLQFMRSLFAVQ